MTRKILRIALIVIVFASIGGFVWKHYVTDAHIQRAPGYNVVLISLDTTRADFLGSYSDHKFSTPHIDSLAREGVLFESYYSTINTTLAAHSSMFTGFYPRNHGVGRNSMRLNGKNLTLPELLKVQGYTTAAFIGSFALASVFGFNQGFDVYDETFIGSPQDYIAKNVKHKTKAQAEWEVLVPKTNIGHISRSAEEVNQAFFEWLTKNHSQKFFAFIHYYDPHFPYLPPREWHEKHLSEIPEGTPLTQSERDPLESQFKILAQPFAGQTSTDISREDHGIAAAMVRLYQAEIEYTDHAVGQIVDRLKKAGLDRNTIVILTADHGENLIEHPTFDSFFRHGFLTYETEIHVPFIIKAHGVLPEGRRVKEIASQIDLLPTLLDLLQIQRSDRWDGVSLLPFLFDDRKPLNRMLFAEASQPHANLRKEARDMVWVNDHNSAAVRFKDWKYIKAPYRQYEAAFKIAEDPKEAKDTLMQLSRKEPELLDRLRTGLETWRSKAMSGNVDSAFQLSDEDREKLESLGYIQ